MALHAPSSVSTIARFLLPLLLTAALAAVCYAFVGLNSSGLGYKMPWREAFTQAGLSGALTLVACAVLAFVRAEGIGVPLEALCDWVNALDLAGLEAHAKANKPIE